MKIEKYIREDFPVWVYDQEIINSLKNKIDSIYVLKEKTELGPCCLRDKYNVTYPTNCKFIGFDKNPSGECKDCFFNRNNLIDVKKYMNKYVYRK